MSTITALTGSDGVTTANSMTKINTNFSNLNTDKVETSAIDTDTTLAANSDSKIASQKATKAYVDAQVTANASETAKGASEEATDAEVTAGTATGGTGAKLFVTPAKLLTYLNGPAGRSTFNTIFENSARFTSIANSGTNTFNTTGFYMDTTITATRASGITIDVLPPAASVFLGSPSFSTSFSFANIGGTGTGSSYFGLGLVTKTGSGHTYTTDHAGFKVLVSGSVASLYGTQGDGTTEAATSALTTLAVGDTVDVYLKFNSTTSVTYYFRKNGGSLSSGTTLSTNMPDTASNQAQISASNDGTGTRFEIYTTFLNYTR